MIAAVSFLLILFLLGSMFHWLAAIPLFRTLSASIDEWADELVGASRTIGSDHSDKQQG